MNTLSKDYDLIDKVMEDFDFDLVSRYINTIGVSYNKSYCPSISDLKSLAWKLLRDVAIDENSEELNSSPEEISSSGVGGMIATRYFLDGVHQYSLEYRITFSDTQFLIEL